MKTGLFIGRFQPPHEGHFACIRRILETCDHVIIALRDTPPSETNPLPLYKRWNAIRAEFPNDDRVSLQIIHDPGCDLTVFIGRDVGYELIQLDPAIEGIRATDIRRKLKNAAGG